VVVVVGVLVAVFSVSQSVFPALVARETPIQSRIGGRRLPIAERGR